MPSPDYKQHQPANSMIMEMLTHKQQISSSDIADEIKSLREEIAALRADLKPARSVIVTGQEVVCELRRLNALRRKRHDD